MSKLVISFAATLLLSSIGYTQNRPFPQEQTWENCIKPTNHSQEDLNNDIKSFYDHWKSNYLTEANTVGYYIQGDNTGGSAADKGTSEGHGYGMVITALMAGYDDQAKTYFDGLFNFFDSHRSSINSELMGWLVDAEESESGAYSSAADGDMDIAYALLLAHDQWGSEGDINYLQEAKEMITLGLKKSDFGASSKRVLLGDWDKDQFSTRSSDWMTAHMHAYFEATEDEFWNEATEEVYSLVDDITENYASNTGLMPDFIINELPEPAGEDFLEGPHDGKYYFNAARFPWRIAMDFGHYGTQESKDHMNKILSWLKPETDFDPYNVYSGYNLDGSEIPGSGYDNATFVSPMVVAATVDAEHQEYLNLGWTFIRGLKSSYFADNINLLCMLYISGNWWAPTGGTINSIPDNQHYLGDVHIYPMPTSEMTTISFSPKSTGRANIKVLDMHGNLLYQAATKAQKNTLFNHHINVKNFTPGVYITEVTLNDHSITRKLLIK